VKRERQDRIDKLLVQRGLADSRTKAQAMVMSGIVLVNEQRVEKPSDKISGDAEIRIKGGDDPTSRYVGRGGLKLETALREFQIDVLDLNCLDIGASTGGFTDCLLQHSAAHVVSIDVGHNQFDWRLRTDHRVEVREGINARYLKTTDFETEFDLIVIDVSFISATKILPAIIALLKDGGRLIILIKPQFEVGRGEVGKGVIVRHPEKHARVIDEVNKAAGELGLTARKVIESPLRGADGNVEFLALYEKG
jgi:23S rRNA (cytidine1920-2'-O)/16S rRNA (cytidine1409-2'-O)-methyltransferase